MIILIHFPDLKTGAAVATAVGITAVVAAPVVLSAVGFGAAGVAAGSIAAAVQVSFHRSLDMFVYCFSCFRIYTSFVNLKKKLSWD